MKCPAANLLASDKIFADFFNGGCALTTCQSYQPREVAFRASRTARSADGTIQLNDVFVDERQIVYAADRISSALRLEMSL